MMGTENNSYTPPNAPRGSFDTGSEVIYGLHGKCQIVAIETKTIGGQDMRFYRLEPVKSALSRTQKKEPAIWIPVDSAKDKGMRAPLQAEEIQSILDTLESETAYFDSTEQWNALHPKLEATIRSEGAVGLAKVAAFLWLYKRQQYVLPTEIQRYLDSVLRVLYREISDTLGEPIRAIEDRIEKILLRREASSEAE